jgi:hypothetical protein
MNQSLSNALWAVSLILLGSALVLGMHYGKSW